MVTAMKLCQARITRGPAELQGCPGEASGKLDMQAGDIRSEVRRKAIRTSIGSTGKGTHKKEARFEKLNERLARRLGEDVGRASQVVVRRNKVSLYRPVCS